MYESINRQLYTFKDAVLDTRTLTHKMAINKLNGSDVKPNYNWCKRVKSISIIHPKNKCPCVQITHTAPKVGGRICS